MKNLFYTLLTAASLLGGANLSAAAAVDAAAQPAAQPVAAQPAAKPAPVTAQPAAKPAPAAAQPAVKPAPVAAQPAAQPVAAPAAEEKSGIMFCFARGLCNLTTGWLEIPRCMVYDNGFMPVFGLIVGIPEGALLGVCRELSGVYDIVSFGTGGDVFHGKIFPHTIFQSKWSYQGK